MANLSAFTMFSGITDGAPASPTYLNAKFSILSTNLDQLNADASTVSGLATPSASSVVGWNKGSITTTLNTSSGTLSVITINAASGNTIVANAAFSTNTIVPQSGNTISFAGSIVSSLVTLEISYPQGFSLVDPTNSQCQIFLSMAGRGATVALSNSNFQFGSTTNIDLVLLQNNAAAWRVDSTKAFVTQPTDPGGPAILRISGATIRLATPYTPPTGTSSGNTGEWCSDGSYFYICTSNASWMRFLGSRF